MIETIWKHISERKIAWSSTTFLGLPLAEKSAWMAIAKKARTYFIEVAQQRIAEQMLKKNIFLYIHNFYNMGGEKVKRNMYSLGCDSKNLKHERLQMS